jgi:amino acid adenylation domain-containing protein
MNADKQRPLTPGQQLLYQAHQGRLDASLNNWFIFELRGALDQARFCEAVRLVANLFLPLRAAVILSANDELVEVVREPYVESPCELADMRQRAAAANSGADIDYRLAREIAKKPFRLEGELLARFHLLRYSGELSVFVFAQHHIVFDGPSGRLLVTALSIAYQQGKAALMKRFGRAGTEGDAPAVCAAAGATWVAAPKARQYWRSKLAGIDPAVDFRISRRLRQVSEKTFWLGGALKQLIGVRARAAGATPFIVLSGALAVFLHRYLQRSDFLAGYPVNSRPIGQGDAYGFYVTECIWRFSIRVEESFSQLLQRLVEQRKGDRRHQCIETRGILEALDMHGSDRSGEGVNVFVGRAYLSHQLELDGVSATLMDAGIGQPARDFSLLVDSETPDLACRMTSNAALFAPEFLSHLALRFRELVAVLIGDPEQPLKNLAPAAADQIALTTAQHASTLGAAPEAGRLDTLFADSARRHPENVALEHGQVRMSYRELDGRSERLAVDLRVRGVGPEDCVGIYANPCIELLVGILAILKAGAAYVPIDRNYPAGKICGLARHATLKAVVTQTGLMEQLGAALGELAIPIVPVHLGPIVPQAGEKLPALTDPRRAAYVIYTSGSEGIPKGVVVEHGSAAARLAVLDARYPLGADDAYLLKTNYAFDVSVTELFGWMFRGGRLVIPDADAAADPSSLAACIADRRITHLNFVPSLLAAFLDGVDVRGLSFATRLKWIFVAGEALRASLANRAYAMLPPNAAIENLYGPTEATIYATAYSVPRAVDPVRDVPIGSPLAGSIGFVLDRQRQPVPVGVVGELFIGGQGIAREYFGDPALTADRFFRTPLFPGLRMYKSGDLVRYAPDGNLEFHGRIDTQVKLRGVRVELSEVEQMLLAHPRVSQAAVVVGGGEGVRLIAFFVSARRHAAPIPAELAQHAGAMLPHYMIPARYVQLARMPTTPNGKLDRSKLTSLAAETMTHESAFVAPESGAHRALAKLWCALLRTDRVGIRDNFFDCGGTSILAMQLVARINWRFNCRLDIAQIMEHNTIEGMARLVFSGGRIGPSRIPALDLHRAALSFAQERIWYGAKTHNCRRYNLWTDIDIGDQFDCKAAAEAIALLIRWHDSLRMGIRSDDGTLSLFVEREAEAALKYVDLSAWHGEEKAIAHRDALRDFADAPFSLQHPPLVRFLAVDLGLRAGKLYLCIHHIVSDAFSLLTLRADVAKAYRACLEGGPLTPPPSSCRYADFAAWDRSRPVNRIRLSRANALADHLVDLRRPPDLPHEPMFEQEPAPTGDSDLTLAVSVNREMSVRLTRFAQQHRVSAAVVLHAAYAVTIGLVTGIDDVTIAVAFANRNDFQVQSTVGTFVNVLPLRTVLNRGATYSDALHAVKDRMLHLLANQEIPLQMLVKELRRRTRGSDTPDLEVWPYAINVLEFSDDLHMSGELFDRLCARGSDAALTLSFRIGSGDDLQAAITYRSDRFPTAAVSAFSRRYLHVLGNLLDRPDSLWAATGVFNAELAHKLGLSQAQLHFSVAATPTQMDMQLRADLHYGGRQIIGSWRILDAGASLATWRTAFGVLFDSEATLRSRIVSYAGQTFQVFADFKDEQIVVTDPIASVHDIDESSVWRIIREDLVHARGQQARVLLTPASGGGGIAIFYGTQTVVDGVSITSAWRAVDRIHSRLLRGICLKERSDADPIASYADVQKRYTHEHVDYWRKRFASVQPLAGPRFAAATSQQKTSWWLVSDKVHAQLSRYAKSLGVNLFDVIVSVYALMLFRLFRPAGDFVLYEPVRPARFGRSIGAFLEVRRILFERSHFEQDWLFSDYVKGVSAVRHSDQPPLSLIQESAWVQPAHTFSVNCIPAFENPGWLPLNSVSPNETQLTFYPGRECAFSLTSDDNRVLESAILERFDRILSDVQSERCGRTSEVSLLSAEERRLLLDEWGGSDLALPCHLGVQDLFAAQAQRTPDAIAVAHNDTTMTYAQLNDRSSHLAALLQRRPGFAAGCLVGLMVRRGINMLVGMLGILKSGAAYVPLDPDYPAKRIVHMLGDSNVCILVTESALAAQAAHAMVVTEAIIYCDDSAEEPILDAAGPARLTAAQDPAYILYTSGSTGQPKGVIVNHVGLLNLALAMKEAYRVEASDRVLQQTSLSFDMSVEEIFPYLISGATVVIGPGDPSTLPELIAQHRITILNLLPSWGLLIANLPPEIKSQLFKSIRLIAFGGDVLSPAILDRLRGCGADIVNAYGPTECTVNATIGWLTDAQQVSIGKPIANTRAYVLNDALDLVPVGFPGELFIAGPGVSPGYLGQPELTARAFIADPLGEGRMYRTGDLARWRQDGTLEFLGRGDRQTKVHGYRVECGEIEAALLDHPGVSSCAVVASQDKNSAVLVAFIVAKQADAAPDAADLARFLGSCLPVFMIPAAFVALEALPKTSSGKIDYGGLADRQVSVSGQRSYTQPTTAMERLILSIWEDVLRLRGIGIDENFFALGGDSLLALQVLSRINREVSDRLSLRHIFEASTIRRLASVLGENIIGDDGTPHSFVRSRRQIIL